MIEIPQSATAHQARDHKYYKRANFSSNPMEDYEIRDVMNRAKHPRVVPSFQIERYVPQIAPTDLCAIRERLKSEPGWMQVSFEIALTTGLRMRETAIPLGWIDLERNQFTVIAKGGRPFTSKFDPFLLPLFARLKLERGESAPACDIPYNASRIWCRFFRQLGMPYCFHCLRVSFICRCGRAGVPEAIAMRLGQARLHDSSPGLCTSAAGS